MQQFLRNLEMAEKRQKFPFFLIGIDLRYNAFLYNSFTKFQKQIFLSSFPPNNKRNIFLKSAIAAKMG